MIERNPQITSDQPAVGIVCKPGRPDTRKIAERIADFLISQDVALQVDEGSCVGIHSVAEERPISGFEADFVITIGGDGTILYTLSKLKDRETPLFCVNRGNVGFLTESSTTTAVSSLKKILHNDCIIDKNINLISGVGEREFGYALNEVYVASSIPGRLLTFQVYVDGVRIDYGRADGAMLSTPVGSTAYALAAGGSIVAPDVDGLIFVPVCPPRFELKSIVVSDDSTVELELVKSGAHGLAIIDGQRRLDVKPGEAVWIKKSDVITRFIRMSDNYYDRLNTRIVPRTL
ncbi:MAG: NAD(+)/NADH kinase [Candidatus Thorarchaeota archaeon]|nr:NAD(+)/NADH kinase [Candidatus Thorarchaeota archaeon]